MAVERLSGLVHCTLAQVPAPVVSTLFHRQVVIERLSGLVHCSPPKTLADVISTLYLFQRLESLPSSLKLHIIKDTDTFISQNLALLWSRYFATPVKEVLCAVKQIF
jgi:hypothetical protein